MKKFKSGIGVSAAVLLVSGIVCKILGALFRLPLTNLLGINGIGVFQLVMSLYAFALVVTCGGVTNSLAKLISSARARGEMSKIRSYTTRAFLMSVGSGIFIGTLFLFLGRFVAAFQGIDGKSYLLFVFLLPLGAGLATLRGFFQGYERMTPTAVSQIVEQVFRFALGLLFAFYFGKFGQGVFGAFLGIVFAEILALAYLFVLFFMRKDKPERDLSQAKFARKEFDRANFPLMLSASILPLVNAFDGLIIIPRLLAAGFTNATATSLFGLQSGVVGAVLNFPLIISVATTTALLPNISYLVSRGTGSKILIERGMKVLLFLILPTTFGLVAICRQVFALVYPSMSAYLLETSFNLMLFGGFGIVFTALMQYLVMLLQAYGQFRYILTITALGGLAKAVLSFCLSPIANINIYALVLGNIVLSAIVCVLALARLKKIAAFSLGFGDLMLLLFSTLAMFVTVHTYIQKNYMSLILNVGVAIILGMIVYFVLTIPFAIKIKSFRKKV